MQADAVSQGFPSPGTIRRSRIGRRRGFALSLDRPEPFSYLLDVLYPPHGRRERWAFALARLLPWSLGAGWLLATGRVEEVLGEDFPLLRKLFQHPDLLTKEITGKEPVSWIAASRTRRRGDSPSELLFAFPDGSVVPTAVLELHPAGESAASSREAGALRWLASNLSPPLAKRVPEALFHVARNDLEVLALSALPGPSSYVELRRRGPSRSLTSRHLDRAADWLICFHRETRSRKTWELPEWRELAPTPFATRPEPDWWSRLRSKLDRGPLLRVGLHGDFWARNLLSDIGRGRSGVVDWGAFETNSSPLVDLYDFPLSYGELLSGTSSEGSVDDFLETFDPDGALGSRVWSYVRVVLAGMGVAPETDRSLLAVYLLDRARHVGLGPPGRFGRDRPASFWMECFRRWQP